MGKILIIAEKPSVMTDLSKALAKPLGKFEKVGAARDAYFENDNAVISSAVGHLVELRMPTGPNGKKLPWKFDVLPAIPEKFELEAKPDTEARLKQILKLARRKDVDLLVNACDAGREGELIFQYIIDFGGITKPTKRLWMQSMTQGAILEAWDKLRSDVQMQPLADAARCRSESDWLVGLNATRAFTCFNSRHGGFNITAAGRVQTPTLAILAAREAEIRAFKPEGYHEVHANFGVAAGDYFGKWIDTAWKKDAEKPHGRPERIWERPLAEAIVARCTGKSGTVSEEKKAQSQIAPQLYDLTTLQREAPFSAKGTLQIAQALYEKHKVITYPRTDSRYLPEDYFGNVRSTMGDIASSGHPNATHARAVLDGKEDTGPHLHKARRIFDNKKVSDHFAIIPTGKTARLSDTEQKVFDMIVKRFIAVFYPHAEFEQTTRLTTIAQDGGVSDVFRTDGRVLVRPGWLEVYGRRPGVAAGKDDLVGVTQGENAEVIAIELLDEETKPPARYTESTLLSAMEGAGKLIDDEALREAMAERGLGTPATRAATIEGLIAQKYLARDGRELHVSGSGMRLIDLVRDMEIEGLASPHLTGDWEFKLRQMEQGLLQRDEFMREIIGYTRDIVERAHARAEEARNRKFPDLNVTCPACGAPNLRQTDATYECRETECKFKAKKHIAGRLLTEDEAKELFSKGFVGPLTGFKSKFNKPFDAGLEMDAKFKINFKFDNEEDEAPELTEDQLIGETESPDGKKLKVYQTDKAYHLPGLVTKKDPNGVRIGRSILQCEIPPDQLMKMIAEGKTGVLKGFVSNRTKRKFDAFLTFDPAAGKIGFEFPPRPAAKKSAKKAAKKTPSKNPES